MTSAHVDKAAVTLTTQEYFRLFCEVVGHARHSLLIAGWDFQPDLALVRRANGDGLECIDRLGDIVTDVANENPDLQVRIISWDFSKYFGDAETLIDQTEWIANLPDNVAVEFDPAEIAGGAHHHKIVVVDDHIGFVGGTDLSVRRWDTSDRPPVDPRRVDPTGADFPPWHDVQMLLQGDAARCLGDFVREQWNAATGESLSPAPDATRDVWPEVDADFEDLTVAFARTWPFGSDSDAQLDSEIEDAYRDLINGARDVIYIENQYFSHEGLIDALERRLAEPDGPEVVVVVPASYREAREEKSFAKVRDQHVNRLRENDPHDRFRAMAPWSLRGNSDEDDVDVYVHAKLMIADDQSLIVGSANLAERSLNVDTEVSAIVTADDEAGADRIARVRNRLLALHTGKGVDEVANEVAETGSLAAFLDQLNATDGPTLRALETDSSPEPAIPMWFADPDRSLWRQWQVWVTLGVIFAVVAVVVVLALSS